MTDFHPEQIRSLRLEHITKRFPGILAYNDISITIGTGKALALVEENGTRKTTLMNILINEWCLR